MEVAEEEGTAMQLQALSLFECCHDHVNKKRLWHLDQMLTLEE